MVHGDGPRGCTTYVFPLAALRAPWELHAEGKVPGSKNLFDMTRGTSWHG